MYICLDAYTDNIINFALRDECRDSGRLSQNGSIRKRQDVKSRYNVLFLCTGNSARSIMAEAILKRKSMPNFGAFSAGSHPAGFVRPKAIKQSEAAHMNTEGFYSRSWNEFSQPTLARTANDCTLGYT